MIQYFQANETVAFFTKSGSIMRQGPIHLIFLVHQAVGQGDAISHIVPIKKLVSQIQHHCLQLGMELPKFLLQQMHRLVQHYAPILPIAIQVVDLIKYLKIIPFIVQMVK